LARVELAAFEMAVTLQASNFDRSRQQACENRWAGSLLVAAALRGRGLDLIYVIDRSARRPARREEQGFPLQRQTRAMSPADARRSEVPVLDPHEPCPKQDVIQRGAIE
jgi:hypothetical protein